MWPGAVLRGDDGTITVGARTSVQDGTVIHADPGSRPSSVTAAWSATWPTWRGARRGRLPGRVGVGGAPPRGIGVRRHRRGQRRRDSTI